MLSNSQQLRGYCCYKPRSESVATLLHSQGREVPSLEAEAVGMGSGVGTQLSQGPAVCRGESTGRAAWVSPTPQGNLCNTVQLQQMGTEQMCQS